MAVLCLDTASAQFLAVSAASQVMPGTMAPSETWRFTTDIECFITQGLTPTATAGTGSSLIAAGASVEIYGAAGAHLAVIGAVGKATLTRLIVR